MSEENNKHIDNSNGQDDGVLAEMAGVLASMPDTGKPTGLSIKESLTTVCACGKKIHALTPTFFKFLNDGAVLFQNNVCPGCKEGEKLDASMARFVCVKCKRAWHRIEPAKDNTGFAYKAGHSYHTDGCPYCAPEGKTSVRIIEKVLHDRKLGKKV